MAIGVSGEGQARPKGELAEDVEIASGRFLLVEPPGEELARSIIDRCMEDEARSAIFEPGMMAAIELDEHPFLGHALAARAMLRRTAATWTGEAGLVQEATDGLARDS